MTPRIVITHESLDNLDLFGFSIIVNYFFLGGGVGEVEGQLLHVCRACYEIWLGTWFHSHTEAIDPVAMKPYQSHISNHM